MQSYLRPVASRKPLPQGCIPAPMVEQKLILYLRPVASRRNHFRQDVFLRQRWNGSCYRTLDQSPAGGTTSARMYFCACGGTEVDTVPWTSCRQEEPLPPGCIPAPTVERKLILYLRPVASRRDHFRQDVFLRQRWNGS